MLPSIFLVAAEDYKIKRIPSSIIPKILHPHLKTANPSSCHTHTHITATLKF